MKKMIISLITTILFLIVAGCGPVVRTHLKQFTDNPEEFQGKQVIVSANLNDILDNPEIFMDDRIRVEVPGYIKYNGFMGFSHWNLILRDNEGSSIRCYEREYRVDSWNVPRALLLAAERKNERIIVVGRLQKTTELLIETDWIEYDGQIIDTDYLPPPVPVGVHY